MPEKITAQQVVDRIQKNIGPSWKASPADAFVSGRPETQVTGVVTTFTPSFDVMRRALAGGQNMIVSRENPYWNRGIAVAGYSGAGAPMKEEDLRRNPTYAAKRDFIEKNNLVIYRFFDNWNARRPDAQLKGLAKALGWSNQSGSQYFAVPKTNLEGLAKSIAAKLKIKGLRVIGNPGTAVARAAVTHGFLLVPELQSVLREPGVDVVVAGEPVEWEAGPYFNDLVASGQKKGMIVIGHEASEEPGCGELAAWMETFVTEVPVTFLPAGEPFWVPKKAAGAKS